MNAVCIKCGNTYRLDDGFVDKSQLYDDEGNRRMIGLRRDVYCRYENCLFTGIMAVKCAGGDICPICAAEFFMTHAKRLLKVSGRHAAGSGFGEQDNFGLEDDG